MKKTIIFIISFLTFLQAQITLSTTGLSGALGAVAVNDLANPYLRGLEIKNITTQTITQIKVEVALEPEIGSLKLNGKLGYIGTHLSSPTLTTSLSNYTITIPDSLDNFILNQIFFNSTLDSGEVATLTFSEIGKSCSPANNTSSYTVYYKTTLDTVNWQLAGTATHPISVPSPSIYTGGVSLNEHLFQMQCTFIPDSSFWSPDSAAPNDLRFVYKNINKLF